MNLDEIKHDRLSEAERFLLDVFDGLEEYVNNDYPDSIFYKKDYVVMFEYDSKTQHLWYSYERIREVFRDKFDINLQETNDLVQSMVETNLKLCVNTIHLYANNGVVWVETNLKLCVNTIRPGGHGTSRRWKSIKK